MIQAASKESGSIHQPASNIADSHAPTQRPGQTSSLGSRLEDISLVFVNLVNERDFSFSSPESQTLKASLTPDFVTYMHNLSKCMALSAQDAVLEVAQIVEQYPTYHEEILNVDSTVDEKSGSAIVSLHVRVFGHGQEGSVVEAVREARWRREGDAEHGRWGLYEYIGFRGISVDGAAMWLSRS